MCKALNVCTPGTSYIFLSLWMVNYWWMPAQCLMVGTPYEMSTVISKRYYRQDMWKYIPPATEIHPQWTNQPATCRLQRKLWTPTWGLPLGEVQIRIWDLCGWGGGIISLFLHNHPHQLLMILNIMCHHLDHWVCHWIRFSQCYWGQIVWSIMFLLSTPHNLLGLGRMNWRRWRSEDQKRQALEFPR